MEKKKTVNILFVDSSESGTKQVVSELKKKGFHLSFLRIENYDEFRAQILAFKPDVIIAEYLLPGWDGQADLPILFQCEQMFCNKLPPSRLVPDSDPAQIVASLHKGTIQWHMDFDLVAHTVCRKTF